MNTWGTCNLVKTSPESSGDFRNEVLKINNNSHLTELFRQILPNYRIEGRANERQNRTQVFAQNWIDTRSQRLGKLLGTLIKSEYCNITCIAQICKNVEIARRDLYFLNIFTSPLSDHSLRRLEYNPTAKTIATAIGRLKNFKGEKPATLYHLEEVLKTQNKVSIQQAASKTREAFYPRSKFIFTPQMSGTMGLVSHLHRICNLVGTKVTGEYESVFDIKESKSEYKANVYRIVAAIFMILEIPAFVATKVGKSKPHSITEQILRKRLGPLPK